MKMAPGAELPDHGHMQIEQTFVLKGHLVCHEGEFREGQYVWRPAGSRHKAWSPSGGLMLAIFQVPNQFFGDSDGEDMLGQNCAATWGDCRNMQGAG